MPVFLQISHPENLVFIIFFSIGLLELLIIYFMVRYRKKIIAKGYDAKGTVIHVIESRGNKGGRVYKPVIRYSTYLNEPVEVTSKFGSSPNYYPLGSEMDIYYDPDQPAKFVIKNDKRMRWFYLVIGVIAGIFFLIGLAGLVASNRLS